MKIEYPTIVAFPFEECYNYLLFLGRFYGDDLDTLKGWDKVAKRAELSLN